MSDQLQDLELQGEAGAVVRSLRFKAERAKSAVEAALKSYEEARLVLDIAEKELAAAERVYAAGRADLNAAAPIVRITSQKQDFLRVLSRLQAFGSAEMKWAAQEVGWDAKDGALRTLASDYCRSGLFERLGRGMWRVDRKRVLDVAPEILSPSPKVSATPDGEAARLSERDGEASEAEEHSQTPFRGSQDYFDDDLPF